MSTRQSENAPNSGELLQALRETPTSSLTKNVQHFDKLTPEEEDGHGRWLKSQKKKLINKLFSWFMHFLFVVVCLVVVVLVTSGIYLTAMWIGTFINDAEKLGGFIYGVWNTALVALATLFISGLIPKD